MSSKIADAELQALLEAATRDTDESTGPLNSAERFLVEFPIERGDQNVKTEIIYHFYVMFCRDVKAKPLPPRHFFRYFTGKFESRHGKMDRFYKLKPEPFALSEDELLEFQRQRRYYKHVWLPLSELRKNQVRKKAEKQRRENQRAKLKEKLKRKHGTSLSTPDSTDGSSQK